MPVLVLVPTYDEAPNIVALLEAVRSAVPAADVLVIDDASPDGTAELAEKAAADLDHVTVLRRPGKDGLGNAYREGFGLALGQGYDVLVTLDADFSHDPAVIPALLAEIEGGADLVVGSRYVPGGSSPNWPVHRRALSRYGNRYTGWALGLTLRDATSGFRAYRAGLLREIAFQTTRSNGYAFMTELAFRVSVEHGRVVEVPITFADRERGVSKMSASIIAESMARVTYWGARLRLARWSSALRTRRQGQRQRPA